MNTPPVFSVYSVNLMLKWLETEGGVEKIYQTNKKKSKLIYDYINESKGFYIPRVISQDDRSNMNIVFNIKNQELEKKFIIECEKIGLVGLSGKNGIRSSIYNAMTFKGLERLVDFMKLFAGKYIP
jgi:phosphoserine aminotransferase